MPTASEILAAFDSFVFRQYERTGDRRMSPAELDGLQVAQDALEDIIAGRMV